MDTINKVKKDYTIYGLINTLMYLFGCFLLLPFLHIFFKIKISLLNYIIWYVWSLAYTIYVLYTTVVVMPVVPFVKSPHGLTKENTLILYNEARLFSAREAVLASISQIFRMKKRRNGCFW